MESLWRGEVKESSSLSDGCQGETVRWLAEIQGRTVGHIRLVARREHAGVAGEISPLYVNPELQGVGIGRMLLNKVEGHAQEKGMPALGVFAFQQGPAIAFYEHEGFQCRRLEWLVIGEQTFPVVRLWKSIKEITARQNLAKPSNVRR